MFYAHFDTCRKNFQQYKIKRNFYKFFFCFSFRPTTAVLIRCYTIYLIKFRKRRELCITEVRESCRKQSRRISCRTGIIVGVPYCRLNARKLALYKLSFVQRAVPLSFYEATCKREDPSGIRVMSRRWNAASRR